MSAPESGRNLFEIENARNLNRDEVVATFVPTETFWRLLSPKNHIVLGARGSGKTALAKMLSHDHLSQLDDERAREIVTSRNIVGIYIPTSIEWVGALKNKPWQSEEEQEQFFQWRLNIASCLSFLVSLRSCLDRYFDGNLERVRVERRLCGQLSSIWSSTGNLRSIKQLDDYLRETEYRKQQQIARRRVLGALPEGELPAGIEFETDLFLPLRRAVDLANEALRLAQNCCWLVCLDEAEFLDEIHHRVLNTHLRSDSGRLAFKITTMPYSHYTQETNTPRATLNLGHDFDYVYIDRDHSFHHNVSHEVVMRFAENLFGKRATETGGDYLGLTLKGLLGPSKLIDSTTESWEEGSENFDLLMRYSNESTRKRALGLLPNRSAFRDQISRKMHGAIKLRTAVASAAGATKLDVYSGAALVVRCGDGNPRRLIRLFQRLLREVGVGREVAPTKQTDVLESFSGSVLSRTKSEPEVGPELFEFLTDLGEYMRSRLHSEPLSTDQVTAFRFDTKAAEYWPLIERAVGLGLLFPSVSPKQPDIVPQESGTFHMAAILAPHFRLLPRRGRALNLSTIISRARADRDMTRPGSGTGRGQGSLFS